MGFDGLVVPDALKRLVARDLVAGVVLFGRNIESDSQLFALARELASLFADADAARAEPRGAPIFAVDQEGGAVQRVRPPAVAAVPRVQPMRDAVQALKGDEGALEALGHAMGQGLRAFGFNVDFAPVLDVDTNPANPIIGARAFGTTPERVIATALPFARGLERAGVAWCGKHFPGHGDTDLDSHLALPKLGHDRARLDAVELAPFRAAVAAGASMLMSAHVVFEALDAALPATLSARVIPEVLRRDLGYDQVVVSDDLEMAAIRDHYDVATIARGLAAADVDLALVCRDLDFAEALALALLPSAAADRRIRRLRRGLSPLVTGPIPPFPSALAAALMP